jgi:hypothetical protein
MAGTSAAAESTISRLMACEAASFTAISKASSADSGITTASRSSATPRLAAYAGSKQRSTSIQAAPMPFACARAAICSASVVLPEPLAPKISAIAPSRQAAVAKRRVERDETGGENGWRMAQDSTIQPRQFEPDRALPFPFPLSHRRPPDGHG